MLSGLQRQMSMPVILLHDFTHDGCVAIVSITSLCSIVFFHRAH